MRRTQELAADQTIEAVQAQRAAHDAYCAALEKKIECLEARLEEQFAGHMLTYTFLVGKRRDVIGEYVEHCLGTTDEEWRRGISAALDGLDEYSDAAMGWQQR